jgi:hypothetical protein
LFWNSAAVGKVGEGDASSRANGGSSFAPSGEEAVEEDEDPRARRWTGAGRYEVWTDTPAPTSHRRTVPSRDEERTCRPRSMMADEVTARVCPVRVRGLDPVVAEKIRRDKSVEVDKMTWPDGNCYRFGSPTQPSVSQPVMRSPTGKGRGKGGGAMFVSENCSQTGQM